MSERITERTVPDAVKARRPDLDQCARELYGEPPEWEVYRWEAIGKGDRRSGVLVTGAVAPLKTRGKYKGHKDWGKLDPETENTYAISDRESDAWLLKWEAETGFCSKCHGSGLVCWRFSVETGSEYKPCKACDGTGHKASPPATSAASAEAV